MSVREIYETAFDSTAKQQQDADYLDDLVQSPLIQGYDAIPSSNDGNLFAETSAKMAKCHKRNHRVANSMESLKLRTTTVEVYEHPGRSFGSSRTPLTNYMKLRTPDRCGLSLVPTTVSQSLSENVNRRFTGEESMSTLTNVYRPKSDPLDRRKTDPSFQWPSGNSLSSRNPPVFQTTASTTTTATVTTSEQYTSKSTSSKTFSPSTEFKKLEVGGDDKEDEKEDEQDTAKNDGQEILETVDRLQFPCKVRKSESVEEGLFLKPKAMSVWAKDYNKRSEKTVQISKVERPNSICSPIERPKVLSLNQAERPKALSLNQAERPKVLSLNQEERPQTLFKPAERPKSLYNPVEIDGRNIRDDMKRQFSQMSAVRSKLSLDLNQPSKRPRRHFLDFWTPGHDAFHRITNPTVELEKQDWYHGYSSRNDAEIALRALREGSFLVRYCQKSPHNYSLSLKSANGVMHIKIARTSTGRYVLKQQSRSFETIPELVHYFSVHSLPVYGLEHIILKYPVISQLL